MHIAEMHIPPIAISDPPLLNAAGLHAPYALRIIVELVSDCGISGLSEIPGSQAVEVALSNAREVVIGRDPCDLNRLMATLEEHFGTDGADSRGLAPWDQRRLVHIFSAVEVACLDMVGKDMGRPVVDLIGGAARDRVPFAAYLFFKYEGRWRRTGLRYRPRCPGLATRPPAGRPRPGGHRRSSPGDVRRLRL